MIHDEDPRFKNLERKLGIFLGVALAGLVAAAILFGLQKDLFSRKYNLRFTADRGTGFTKGMPVKLSGFRIGRVTGMKLNKQATVDVTFEIDADYVTWIRKDSAVKLVKEGLVGDTILDISAGSPNKPQVKDKDTVIYEKTKGLDELADDLAEKVKPVLADVRDIISYINDPEGDLKKTIRNAELLTRNLEGTRKHADTLLVTANDRVQSVTTHANTTLDSVRSKIDSIDLTPSLNRINGAIERIDARIPTVLDKTESTLDNVNRISLETRLLTEKAFPKIPGVLSQAEDVMFSTDRLLKSLQNSWLLRDSGDSGSSGSFIRGDSYE